MKQRIILSIALILSIVLVSLTSADQVAQAQNQLRAVGDTGVIKLGPGQQLRVTVAAGVFYNDLRVSYVRTGYTDSECRTDVACKLFVTSQTTSPVIGLSEGEALVVDGADLVVWQRIMIMSNRPDVTITAIVFDTSTQRVVSIVQNGGQGARW